MSKRIELLNEIKRFQYYQDISIGLSHFKLITNSLFRLTQSLFDYNENPEYHLRELEGKYFRFGLANQSLIRLLNGNKFKLVDKDVLIPDIFALKSLTRMQIESYLIMHYLFFEEISNDEKSFRYDIYKIHALQKQLGFEINYETEFIEKQKLKIQKELQQAVESMKNCSIFKDASEKKRREYLKPKFPKLVDSKYLFESSGLSKVGMNKLWQLYSNYAHAEHISDRQYNTAYNIRKSFSEDFIMVITINLILTSRLVKNISEIFEGAKTEYDKLEEKEKNITEYWFSLKG